LPQRDSERRDKKTHVISKRFFELDYFRGEEMKQRNVFSRNRNSRGNMERKKYGRRSEGRKDPGRYALLRQSDASPRVKLRDKKEKTVIDRGPSESFTGKGHYKARGNLSKAARFPRVQSFMEEMESNERGGTTKKGIKSERGCPWTWANF